MPTYEYECKCGWSGDIISHVDARDKQKCPSCSNKPNRILSTPSIHAFGGLGDRFRYPETLADEQALYLKKHKDETTFNGNASGEVDGDRYNWVPGKGVPEKFQPNIK